MAIKTGKVMKVSGNEALVQIRDHSSCSKCGGCGTTGKNNENTIWVKNNKNAGTGEFVEIEISNRNLFKLSFLIYLLPITLLLVGIIVGNFYAQVNNLPENLVGFLTGIVFMSISFLGVNIVDRRARKSGQYKPELRYVNKR